MVDTSKVTNRIQARSQAESPQLRRHRGVVQAVDTIGLVDVTIDGGSKVITGLRQLAPGTLMPGSTVELIGDDTDMFVIGRTADYGYGTHRISGADSEWPQDFNTDFPSGFYTIQNGLNAPTASAWHYLLVHQHNTLDWTTQIAWDLYNTQEWLHGIYMRRKHAGTWQPWQLIAGMGKWQVPTLENGWVDYGGGHAVSAYRKIAGNRVELKGLIKGGTARGIFTLPAGYRPAEIMILNHTRSTGVLEFRVHPSGVVESYPGYDATWMSLSGVSFAAG